MFSATVLTEATFHRCAARRAKLRCVDSGRCCGRAGLRGRLFHRRVRALNRALPQGVEFRHALLQTAGWFGHSLGRLIPLRDEQTGVG